MHSQKHTQILPSSKSEGTVAMASTPVQEECRSTFKGPVWGPNPGALCREFMAVRYLPHCKSSQEEKAQ